MTLKAAYEQGIEKLRNAGVPDPEIDAWYLLEYATGITRAFFYADPERKAAGDELEKFKKYIEIRADRVPLQHITGVQEFMGLDFFVNENVLIPRQDTEILVEEALRILKKKEVSAEKKNVRVLDMCTGSGCILLSVLHYAPCTVYGTGSDYSAEALKVAEKNAGHLSQHAEFIQGDLFENVSGKYEMILSNPPYIRTEDIADLQDEVRLHDPLEALDGKEDGLYFYRRITAEAPEYLEMNGYLMFEIGYDQAEPVTALMRASGFSDITVKRDLAGLDRIVYGRYIY